MNTHWILRSSAIALILVSPCLANAQADTDDDTLIAPPKVTAKSPTRIRLKTPPELPETDPTAATPPGTQSEPLKGVREEAEALAGAARNQALSLAREGQRIAAQVQRDVLRATEDIKRSARDGKRVTMVMDGRQQTRTLVLPGERTTTEATRELTEDLDVMHRILAKASGRRRDVEKFRIAFEPSQSPSMDALYLEGYGAIFLVSVNFPLVEPEKTAEATSAAGPKDPVWEETRRRARAQSDDTMGAEAIGGSGMIVHDVVGFWNIEVEPYDAARVERLQTKLTAALKHAANIRNLSPEETITIVVTGPAFIAAREVHDEPEAGDLDPDALTELGRGGGKKRGGAIATHSGAPRIRNRESRLTLRAKKGDIDAVAEGKIAADQLPVKITKSGP